MTSATIIHSRSHIRPEEIDLRSNSIMFHGAPVDERGEAAIGFISDKICSRILIEYDYDQMTIKIDEKVVGADRVADLLGPYVSGKNVVLESTTLDFSALFLTVRSLIEMGINDFLTLYVEPEKYSRTTPGADSFALSELSAGYRPIPGAILDLAGADVEAGVFFLGFEPERLERAFEEYQMLSSKDIKVVFGIPAFKPGWELDSIVPHLTAIENCSIAYCSANDPSSAYDTLEATRLSLSEGNKMFIAPIGTKPCGFATALFASVYPTQVGLLYDHRVKMNKRSEGLGVWHRYSVKLQKS